jgi:LCP family protein required for cell wall assembly
VPGLRAPVGASPGGGRGGGLRRALALIALLASALTVAGAGAGWWLANHYLDRVDRIGGAFAGLGDAGRPPHSSGPAGAPPPTVFLIAGSDTPTGRTGGGPDATGRADVLMLVRVDGDRRHVTAVSIPRDSWVPVPGQGVRKINAALSLGGPPLLVRTVEAVTGIRVDHLVLIDFTGFVGLTDALGGVDVDVAQTSTAWGRTFPAGRDHLDGRSALRYVRERKDLPDGDLDRVRRHQNYLRAMAAKLAAGGGLGDPAHRAALAHALLGAVAVDDQLGNDAMLNVIDSLSAVPASGLTFLTAPVRGTGREGAQSVVYLDRPGCVRLWSAMADGTVTSRVAEFAPLPPVPR